jgi:hypothetical protein
VSLFSTTSRRIIFSCITLKYVRYAIFGRPFLLRCMADNQRRPIQTSLIILRNRSLLCSDYRTLESQTIMETYPYDKAPKGLVGTSRCKGCCRGAACCAGRSPLRHGAGECPFSAEVSLQDVASRSVPSACSTRLLVIPVHLSTSAPYNIRILTPGTVHSRSGQAGQREALSCH